MHRTEDPIRGITLSLGATVVFGVADTTAKYLAAGLPVVEIQWIRYAIFLGMSLLAFIRNVPFLCSWNVPCVR